MNPTTGRKVGQHYGHILYFLDEKKRFTSCTVQLIADMSLEVIFQGGCNVGATFRYVLSGHCQSKDRRVRTVMMKGGVPLFGLIEISVHFIKQRKPKKHAG